MKLIFTLAALIAGVASAETEKFVHCTPAKMSVKIYMDDNCEHENEQLTEEYGRISKDLYELFEGKCKKLGEMGIIQQCTKTKFI